MSKNYDQHFDTLFDHVSEKIRLNFAVRNYVNKKLWKSTLFVPMPCHIHTQPHTQREQRGENPVTVTNPEFQIRTD